MAGRPTPFGKYFLLERINVGGMAEVYKAKTVGVEGFEKIVAIKRILPLVAEDEEFIKMFVDEAKITSQLSHANLAQTFDLGRIDDTYYIAMEYVPGKDLRAVFERQKRRGDRMPLPLAAYVISRVCEGLDYAHRKRDASGRELHIVHRDVSPQNVILSYEGEVKLIDFGIAKAATKIAKTQTGILKGKFGYMSPEQVRGLPLDGRSDVFAAGVVLYELCTGERLFAGSSDFSVLEKVQQARVTPPSQVEPSIPLKLERIILKALAREPEDRYQRAAELAGDLTRFLLDTRQRAVTRDDLAAFMKSTFPDDPAQGPDDTRPPRRPPPELERRPPPLPASLTEGIVGEDDPDRTIKGLAPEGPRAEIIVRSKMGPPPPDEPGEAPTRQMRMDELAAAEREHAQREKRAPSVERNGAEARVKDRIEDQETRVRPTPQPPASAPPFVGRMQWMRRIQYGVVFLTLAIAAWALLSTSRPRTLQPAGPGPGQGVTAGRATDEEQAVPVPLITVLSSPPGAQVFVDGVRKGVTPALLPSLDAASGHAISVEKTCYRSWQLALPPHAGTRHLAATLTPAAGACPGRDLEATGMPAPEGLPEAAAAGATLGFLNLGSRPSAQVLIDGVDIGQATPLLAWPLKSGTHHLRLAGAGRDRELSVEIRTGETHSEMVDLSPPPPEKRRGRR